MRNFNIVIVIFVTFSACRPDNKSSELAKQPLLEESFEYFGTQIADSNAITAGLLLVKYKKMDMNDTIVSQFFGRVTEVSKAKGCWMKVDLGNGEQTMVRFKDYGFFMPRDIVGKQVIVSGVAFIEDRSVEDQRHFAYDGGKSEKEIALITKVKKTYAFEADGVIIKN
tara:strand:+ start:4622 stop:5125 length:504 start_codon:yes stop_codon:yes gene_type:complete